MNKEISEYNKMLIQKIRACTDDELYNLFDLIIQEMNERKRDRAEGESVSVPV